MSNLKALLAALPKKPVDGYVVTCWQILGAHTPYQVGRVTYTYHVNTPWEVYSPDRPGGLPIIDSWMIAEEHYAAGGRMLGWEAMRELLKKQIHSKRVVDLYWGNRLFTTPEDALTVARAAVAEQIAITEEKLVGLRVILAKLS